MGDFTVILPCAGEGNRLGLGTPKELFEISPGVCLIDFSLNHILAAYEKITTAIKVAVIIRPWKKEVAEYVSRRLPGITVETVLFDGAYREWPGSVYSASGVFSHYNLVLLPDSCLRLREGRGCSMDTCFDERGKALVELVSEALETFRVVFGSVACTEPEILKNLGAMRVEGSRVIGFQDKPLQDICLFNSFWGCYGFRQESGKSLYEFLIQSVHHEAVSFKNQPFFPPGAVPLYSYQDLGTWESIERFRFDCVDTTDYILHRRAKEP
jgi:hypothetical protein